MNDETLDVIIRSVERYKRSANSWRAKFYRSNVSGIKSQFLSTDGKQTPLLTETSIGISRGLFREDVTNTLRAFKEIIFKDIYDSLVDIKAMLVAEKQDIQGALSKVQALKAKITSPFTGNLAALNEILKPYFKVEVTPERVMSIQRRAVGQPDSKDIMRGLLDWLDAKEKELQAALQPSATKAT
jgi:hypothetical protein